MSRSTKTSHVMSLVGKEQKRGGKPFQKPYPNEPAVEKSETAVMNPTLQAIISDQENNVRYEADTDLPNAVDGEEEASSPRDENTDIKEAAEKTEKAEKGAKITAIVPELINEELETVVNRFKIEPCDSNLWKLTRAALEAVRPEYSHNTEEYSEKCNRLRQKVILEMTKAAIRLSKENRTSE